jgi:hypothetical protein
MQRNTIPNLPCLLAARMPQVILKRDLQLDEAQRRRSVLAFCTSAKNRIEYAEGSFEATCLLRSDNKIKTAMGDVTAIGAGASNKIGTAEQCILAAGLVAENGVGACRAHVDTIGAGIAISGIGKTEGAATMSLLCSITDIKVLHKALVSFGGVYSMADIGRAGPLVAAIGVALVHSLNVIGEIRGFAASISAIGVNEIGRMRGIALATVNSIAELDGVAIGLVNFCGRRLSGAQIGLLNIDRSAKRFKVLPFLRIRLGKRESIKTGPHNKDIC